MILFHTILAIGILAGLFDGVQREFERRTKLDGLLAEQQRREDLILRGYIL